MKQNADYERRYLTDPAFHAQVHVGAYAVLERWMKRSVLNQSPTDAQWAEARMTAFTVLAAVDAAEIDSYGATDV